MSNVNVILSRTTLVSLAVNRFCIFLFTIGCVSATSTQAQLITSGVPFQSIGSGYSESNSINWFLSGPGWFANINNQVVPPFGPNLTNTGSRGGVGFSGHGFSGGLNFDFAQGSNRSNVSATPSITTTSGYPGTFFSGEVRPFVMGITPVVGAYPNTQSPLAELVVAEQQEKLSAISQANADRQSDKLRVYLRRAERAESEGDMKMARANYRLALPLADSQTQAMIQTVLKDRFSGKSQAVSQKAK